MGEYNIKAIRQEFKERGIFYTQPELAQYMRSFLPEDVDEVYDPTCGNGGLLSAFGDDVQKYGQDINVAQVHEAEQHLVNFHGAFGDTLAHPAFMERKFRYIIANPPFSIKWEPFTDERFERLPCLPPPSKADYAFLAHILHYLAEDGMAVTLNFPGILYRGQREGKIRRWMIDNNYVDTVVHVEGGRFVDTSIATCIVILRKHRSESSVCFISGDEQYTASFDEIQRNSFQLSPSLYIQPRVEREIIDPMKLEMDARASFLKRLRHELDFEMMVCAMEKIDPTPFLDAITSIVGEYMEKCSK